MVWGGARVDDFWNGRGGAGRVHLAIVLYCTDRSTDLAISQQTQVSRKPRTDTAIFATEKVHSQPNENNSTQQHWMRLHFIREKSDAKNGTDG